MAERSDGHRPIGGLVHPTQERHLIPMQPNRRGSKPASSTPRNDSPRNERGPKSRLGAPTGQAGRPSAPRNGSGGRPQGRNSGRPELVASLTVSGVVRLHPRGFGFLDFDAPVARDGQTDSSGAPLGPLSSAFVPPPVAERFVDSDRVSAAVALEADGRASVVSATLIERPRRLLAGTVVAWGDGLGLRPDGALASKDWRLSGEASGLAVGSCVVVAIAAKNGRWHTGRVVAGPFGPTSAAWVQALAVTRALGPVEDLVPDAFRVEGVDPAEVLHSDCAATLRGNDPEARRAAGRPGAAPARTDRTGEACFTIDGPSTKDLDDAIYARPVAGGVRVEVHIADVTAAVAAGTALDAQAAARATSVYLVGRNIPMLPRRLSEDQLSLLAGERRHCLAVGFTVATSGPEAGAVGEVEVFRSTIASAARLTYQQVEDDLDGTSALAVSPAVAASVAAAASAAVALGTARGGRDTLDGLFIDAELGIGVDEGGDPASHVPAATPVAQALVERLMVAANESVAGWTASRGLPSLYRAHDGVAAEEMGAMEAFAGGPLCAPGSAPTAGEVRVVLDRLGAADPVAAAGFASVTASAMGRAGYRVSPDHHFGLDSRPYCHFTSPIRRYADVVVHRVVSAALDGAPSPYSAEELTALAAHLDSRNGAAARAESLERAMLWSLVLGASLAAGSAGVEAATVSRLTPKGASVRIGRLGVTGFVESFTMGMGWAVSEDGFSASLRQGEPVHLGQLLRVELSSIDGPVGRLTYKRAA